MKNVLYILGEFTDDDVSWMSKAGSVERFRAGDVLIEQGSEPQGVFIVLDGRFSVRVGDLSIAEVGAGEVLGEVSFVDRHPASATVAALASSSVLAIPRDAMRRRIDDDPGFSGRFHKAIATFLADRLRSTLRKMSGDDPSASPPSDLDELDLDRLDSVSRAGERFERVLRTLNQA